MKMIKDIIEDIDIIIVKKVEIMEIIIITIIIIIMLLVLVLLVELLIIDIEESSNYFSFIKNKINNLFNKF